MATSSGRCTTSRTSAQRSATRWRRSAQFTGKAPRGWESPGLTETYDTIDWLAEAGIEYVADWVLDDQPCKIKTAHGPIVSVPYTVEMNDIAMMALQNHPSEEWLRRGIDQFDRLYQEGEKIARVMAISVHPVHHRRAAPHRLPREALRIHPAAPGRVDVDGRADP